MSDTERNTEQTAKEERNWGNCVAMLYWFWSYTIIMHIITLYHLLWCYMLDLNFSITPIKVICFFVFDLSETKTHIQISF